MAARLGSRQDNQKNTHKEVTDNGVTEVATRTSPVGSGSLLEGVVYDYIGFTYPDTVTEVYTYKTGGSGGTTTATVTAVYTTIAKDFLLSVAIVKV